MKLGNIFKNGGALTRLESGIIVVERSRVAIDADGANGQNGKPPAYAPPSYKGPTLDDVRNAGHPGNWFGVVTLNGRADGVPVIQAMSDPAPGAFVSATSLRLKNKAGVFNPHDPFCYVDAATVPFLVICPELVHAVGPVVMACRAVLTNTENGEIIEAVVADGGNANEMGEISVAAAERLGIPGNARGVETDAQLLMIEIFPGVAAVVDGITYTLQPSGR